MNLKKNIFAFAALILCSCICFAEHLSYNDYFPEDTGEETVLEFVRNYCLKEIFSEDLYEYMFENDRTEYVIPFIKVSKYYYPDNRFRFSNQNKFVNPLEQALLYERNDLVKDIISIAPELINMNTRDDYSVYPVPIVLAVSSDNYEAVKEMLPYYDTKSLEEVSIDVVSFYDDGEYVHDYSLELPGKNILAMAVSDRVRNLLYTAGLKKITVFDRPILRLVNGGSTAAIHKVPELTSPVVGVMEGDSICEAVSVTNYVVGNSDTRQRWVQVSYGDYKGWTLEKYLLYRHGKFYGRSMSEIQGIYEYRVSYGGDVEWDEEDYGEYNEYLDYGEYYDYYDDSSYYEYDEYYDEDEGGYYYYEYEMPDYGI